MKNKFIIILIMLALPLSVRAVDESLIPIEEPVYVEQTAETTEDFHNQEIEDIQNVSPDVENKAPEVKKEETPLPYKQPISKKKLIKQFFKAMFLLGVFAFAIYYGLAFYKRFKEPDMVQIKTPDGKTPLSEPEDLESAVDIFLDKTKWV